MFHRLKTSAFRTHYKYFSPTRHKIVRTMGAEFFVRPDNYVDRHMCVSGGYEKLQLNAILDYAGKIEFDAFYDIGANFGLYTCIIGVSGLVSEVHSFECDVRNVYHLYGHVRMNNLLDTVHVHSIAIGDNKKEATLHMAAEDNTGRSSLEEKHVRGRAVSVQQDTIDNLMGAENKNLLIKIDVEGYETNVLKGMRGTLKKNKCLLQIEIFDFDDSQALKLLKDAGYMHIRSIGHDQYFTNIEGF